MTQKWHDLLFAHWPIAMEALRPITPSTLKIDTYDGQAWIGVVPFHMTEVRPRGIPALPWFSAFPELNVRTYVTVQDKPGVFFYSLDAGNAAAVWLARRFFYLPYFCARISWHWAGDRFQYCSRRVHQGAPSAEFRGEYWPIGRPFVAPYGRLDHWLTERYCLYAVDSQCRLYRGEIHHLPWRLQQAAANIQINTMPEPEGIVVPSTPPLLHFAGFQKVLIWALEKVELQ